jgi:hypothetical protein
MADESSPALAALTPNARRMLDLIRSAAGEDRTASLSYSAFADRGISRPSIRHAMHQIEALGFARIEPGPRRVNSYTLLSDWENLSHDEADARRVLARQPRPRRPRLAAPKPPPRSPRPIAKVERKEPEPVRQPSLPVLRFMQDWNE